MSLVGLVNLAERLLNQNTTQGQDAQTAQKAASPQGNQEPQAVTEDQFTPSAQSGQAQATAQAAGLFSVAQFTFFSAAADFLLGQNQASLANLATLATPAMSRNTQDAPKHQCERSSRANSTPRCREYFSASRFGPTRASGQQWGECRQQTQ